MGSVLQADGSELLPVSRCQQTPCSPITLRPSLPKMVLKTEEMSNSTPGSRGCCREEWGLGWMGAGSWGAVREWSHLGVVGLATVVLRSSLTLGMYLQGLCCDSQILHSRGDAPSDPPKILHGRGDAPSDPPPKYCMAVGMLPVYQWCLSWSAWPQPTPGASFAPPRLALHL